MIPITGPISADDFNTEFGYPAGTLMTWDGAIAQMRSWDGSSPISMLEWRGYDKGWDGWVSGSDAIYNEYTPPVDSELRVKVTNNSQYATKSGTMYWRFTYNGNMMISGYKTFSSIAVNDFVYVYDYFGSGFPWDAIQVRFSGSSSWHTV